MNVMKTILGLVIIVRLSSILLPSFRIDMNDWLAWTARLVEVTPLHFYAPNYFSDYFPGYLYILWFLGLTFKIFFSSLFIFTLPFEYYLKLFTNIFDFATAYLVYKIVSNNKTQISGLWAAAFYLINPALFFNSSIWGQVDGILAFFLVLSANFLLELKSTVKFNIAFALSLLIKPQGLAAFPVLFLYFIKNFKSLKYLQLALIPVILVCLSLPFFTKDPLFGLFQLFQKSANTYPYTAMFSYNFWSLIGWWISDSTKFFGVSYQLWGIILYLLSLCFIVFPIFINRNFEDKKTIYFALSLATFSFFLFLTRMHERYLFPFFSFFVITAFIINSQKLKIIYAILSIVHFINLWQVYYYYNFVYLNSASANFILYKLLDQSYNWLTYLSLFLFGVLIFIYYDSFSKKIN